MKIKVLHGKGIKTFSFKKFTCRILFFRLNFSFFIALISYTFSSTFLLLLFLVRLYIFFVLYFFSVFNFFPFFFLPQHDCVPVYDAFYLSWRVLSTFNFFFIFLSVIYNFFSIKTLNTLVIIATLFPLLPCISWTFVQVNQVHGCDKLNKVKIYHYLLYTPVYWFIKISKNWKLGKNNHFYFHSIWVSLYSRGLYEYKEI